MARLMYALDQRHWRAHVILAEHGPLESELEERGISYEVLALSARTNDLSRDELTKPGRARAVFDTFAYAVALRRRVRHRQPDVVHSNSMKAHVYGTIASFGARWALVMHVRDRWSPPYLSDRLARALRLLARFGPDAVLANSSATAKATGVDATVLASPVESHFFAVESPEFPSTIRLGVLGRLAPWKGQDLVITALGQLPSDVPWHLSVAGDALFGEEDYAEGLREQVRDAGLEDRVSFLGHVENVAGFLEGIDVSILTSRSPEPFGNVVVEAMAAGRTVVVPNQGGVTEFVTEGGPGSNGFFYEMDDADSLARVLRRVMVDPDVRWFVGSNARRSAAQFRVERVAQTLEAFYDDLV
jgi:glycosyltransferase involved in cell wall biosynthesis